VLAGFGVEKVGDALGEGGGELFALLFTNDV